MGVVNGMGKQLPSDYDWSWWLGDPNGASPLHPEDEEELESFPVARPNAFVPADPPSPFFDDLDDAPAPRAPRSRRGQRQRRLVRIAAPLLILGLLAALVAVIRLPDTSAQTTIIQSDAGNTPAGQPAPDIQAYIVGAVVHPGVYPLHSGDRVDKLLQAAGGPLPNADLVRVNLAAHVTDGEEVYVPRVGEAIPSGLPGGGPGKVNINTASAQDMHNLLGISMTTANKIVAYREAHGPYTSITQLLAVMSRTTYDKIKDFITV
jgi:competence protein ComEA